MPIHLTRQRWLRRTLLAFAIVLAVAIVTAAVALVVLRVQLGRSLPQLEGEVTVAGLEHDVVVARDARGVPEIGGRTRNDVARGLGFVHAQERFFQMDLARRRAAGEVAELVGAAALPLDRRSRVHRFRARAAAVLASASPQDRALLEAYAAGVNAGLAALKAPPFEYLVLRSRPRPWRAEDCVLVVAAMFFNLQDSEALIEGRAAILHDVLPAAVADFLSSTQSDWDTPIDGERLPPPAIPGPEVFDLRHVAVPRVASVHSRDDLEGALPRLAALRQAPGVLAPRHLDDELVVGSNNWVVAGSRTGYGRAIVANDMHLGLGVPNIWYQASLVWSTANGAYRITGVTLPGVASVVVGSNGHVAWGFTNTTADWSDRVLIETIGTKNAHYRTPEGATRFEVYRERLHVAGADDQWLEVRETIWGPVQTDARGRLYAIRWVPHTSEGLNLRLADLERARSLEEAMTAANEAGIPAQNIVIADDHGNIGWTIAGRIPRRVGGDGRLPASWADGSRGWRGWYAPAEYPRVINPAAGIIVTANNRLVGGHALEMLGDGGYDPGARARQIRDDLLALERPAARDMLRVQLDDRALLMERWRRLVLDALSTTEVAHVAPRREFRRLVLDGWTGRASVPSVGYRLVRQFRVKVGELALAPFLRRARAVDPEFPLSPGRALESAVWALVTARPAHLLDPRYRDWDALIVDAIDQTVAELTEGNRQLADRTWGEVNRATLRHPLSPALPWVARWLDMPRQPLPGDAHMPRVQTPTFGASERLAVSPGREQDGYFHMPAGQSGHPLSRHYGDGQDAWVRGEPTPFLPGPPVSRLVLRPAR